MRRLHPERPVATPLFADSHRTRPRKGWIKRIAGCVLETNMPDDLERLYDAHAPALYAILPKFTRDEAGTRDLLQDIFVRLARQPEMLDGVRDEHGYLPRLAHHAAAPARSGRNVRSGVDRDRGRSRSARVPPATYRSAGRTAARATCRRAPRALGRADLRRHLRHVGDLPAARSGSCHEKGS
ncbi:MAG TPA: hypothetical protein DCY13_09095 [Verrucomicrobiales bacterium]|nr:hypothetical protein [Verrucomicrobiales bacterium]